MTSKMGMKYLSKDILIGFDKYKYNSIDTSPVSKYVTHPFWNWLVEYCPRTIAPNTITLTGFMLLILQFGFFCYYDFHFYASDDRHPEHPPVPTWVFLVAGLCMFWAHTLDGIDGKQARRTGTSSPLGELFDHGLDSWATFFMPVGMYSIFGREVSEERVFYILIGVMITFAISHWEKYNTGVLFLPWGYDISQLGMTALYIFTCWFNYTFFKQKFPLTNFEMVEVFEIIMHERQRRVLIMGPFDEEQETWRVVAVGYSSVYLFSIPMSLYNVYVAHKNGTLKRKNLHESLLPLYPVFLQFALFFTWMKCSSIDVLRHEPRLFYLAFGTVFSNITCRVIVNCMSNTPCQVFNWLLIPLIAIVTGVLTLSLGHIEIYMLYAYTIFVLAAHISYGISVVQELSDHFNIYAFSVAKKPQLRSK